jgi:hypothetical protein
MSAFLTALASGVIIPTVTAIAAAAWKLLGKNEWIAEDFVLAFELLVAAVCVQLAYLGAAFAIAAEPGPATTELWKQIAVQAIVLAVIAGGVLPLFALGMRGYTRQYDLTATVAVRVSAMAGVILIATFLLNFFVGSVL